LREYLKRLEIGADNKEYSCFVHGLLQLETISQNTINKIKSRCFGRFLSAVDVCEICDEYAPDIQITIIKQNMRNDILRKGKSGSIICYLNHWFINEKTNWSKR
jgi:hypothetical protein